MSSTEDVVNKMLGDLSRIPSEIRSNSRVKGYEDIDEIVKKVSQVTEMELKKRGIL